MSADLYKRIRELEDELLEAKDNLRDLRKEFLTEHRPRPFGMSDYEDKILSLLIKREVATRRAIVQVIYDGIEPGNNTINCLVSKLRRKLSPFGIEIKTEYGDGYKLSPEGKRRIEEVSPRPPVQAIPLRLVVNR